MASFVKTQLKAAREAIQGKNFEYGQQICQDILENDSDNYNALVFLGLCNVELNNLDESLKNYEKAISISPQLPLAYQGLMKLHESTNNLRGQLGTWDLLANLYKD
ncbi:Tetratricopeptide repeat protein 37, partial [Kappamyces sp. JEL0680]